MSEPIQIIGGGRMGEALGAGLIAAGFCSPADLRIVEVLAERRDALKAALPGATASDEPIPNVPTIIAVKPGLVLEIGARLAKLGVPRVLSIAAGVRLTQLEDALGDGVPVMRAMPNTPALVGEGASAVAPGSSASASDLAWAHQVLASVGTVVEVSESALDAVTGLSGSGPAYVFLFAEALTEAGVLEGLPRDVAESLANQTLLGAATLLRDGPTDAAGLRAGVTSPGGTTAAGLRALERHRFRAAILDAVGDAAARSRELGEA